jgi:hypothetical protein
VDDTYEISDKSILLKLLKRINKLFDFILTVINSEDVNFISLISQR